MRRLAAWFTGLAIIGLFIWIGWTSPTLNQCISDQYKNYSSNALQENVGSFYRLLIGSRLCLGEYVHSTGDGIIAIFTVILGIATWFLWRATRNLVEDARVTGTNQLKVAQIAADAAMQTADTANKTLIATQRPWVAIGVEISGPLIFDAYGAGIQLKITMINDGQTPATNVFAHPMIFVNEAQPYSATEVIKRRSGNFTIGSLGATMFRDKKVIEFNTPSMAAKEFADFENIAPFVLVTVKYRATFDAEIHQTANLYSLVRRNPNGGALVIVPQNGNLAPAELMLIPLGSYAD